MSTDKMNPPELRLSQAEFFQLPEYNGTFPTGTYTGKRWRRLDGIYDKKFQRLGGKPRWYVCEYGPVSADKRHIAVLWFKPIIRVKVKHRTESAQ